MIKGVNKRIIELNNTESIYFEKAVFYLRPGVRELPAAVSEAEAQKYISRIGLESYSCRRSVRLKRAVIFGLLAVLVAAAVIVFI